VTASLRRLSSLVGLVCASLIVGPATGASARSGVGGPLALVPNAIAFWDAEHGLLGTGFQYCALASCAGGTISLTEDGGKTSRVLLRTHGPVTWLSVAPGGFAWALVDRCSAARGCRPVRFLRTSDGGRSWRPLPRVVLRPSFADSVHGIALSSRACEPAWCFKATLLATRDGGRSWHKLVGPCRGGEQGASLVTPSQAWLLCAGQPGAGNQGKAIYRTTDGGHSWRRLLSPEIGGRPAGGISSYGYALGIAFAPNGAGLLCESRGTLYLTIDGGRRWQPQETVARPEVDFGSSASVVPGRAFALLSRGSTVYRLVATTRGYRHWRTLRVWKVRLR
jgi:photosystem II stability/assembly factor-like uncharacterized protein